MNEQQIKVIDDELIAYNNRDIDTFCSFYHQDAVVLRLDGSIVAEGLSQIKEVYGRFFDKHPNLHCELKSRIVTEDKIIDEEMITGKPDYPNGQHGVVIYQFQGNLILKVWFV